MSSTRLPVLAGVTAIVLLALIGGLAIAAPGPAPHEPAEEAPDPPAGAASPDADPLTEAGRWELFGRGALNDIFFVDGSYGWAAGAGVWRTTDGGATWRRIPLLAGTTLRRILFADRNRGWALGHDNRVLRTEDGGETWTVVLGGSAESYPPLSPLLEYQAPNDLWTVGHYLRSTYYDTWEFGYWNHSTDGGLTWDDPFEPKFGAGLWGYPPPETLDFFDRGHGWIAGEDSFAIGCNHALAKTVDAGQTWTYSCLPVTTRYVTIAISFGSATQGWLSGGAKLWRSTDGGGAWAEQHAFAADITWLQAQDAASAWVQTGATLWRTSDGGATWQLLTGAAPGRVSFRASLEGWGTDGSSIFKTTDGGKTWRSLFTLPAVRAAEWFWDPLTGWRATGATIERTTDGGATWKAAATGLQGIDAFRFVDGRNGWAWHNASLGLVHTTDGGATWGSQNTGSAALTDLQFVDAQHGWVRNGEQIRGTSDGGRSWHDLPTPPLPPPPPPGPYWHTFNQIHFVDAERGWASITLVEVDGPFRLL